jgi:hypothetical protein
MNHCRAGLRVREGCRVHLYLAGVMFVKVTPSICSFVYKNRASAAGPRRTLNTSSLVGSAGPCLVMRRGSSSFPLDCQWGAITAGACIISSLPSSPPCATQGTHFSSAAQGVFVLDLLAMPGKCSDERWGQSQAGGWPTDPTRPPVTVPKTNPPTFNALLCGMSLYVSMSPNFEKFSLCVFYLLTV